MTDPVPPPDDEPIPDPDTAEAIAIATAILNELVHRAIEPHIALAAVTIAWARLLGGMEYTRERFREICAGLEHVIYGDEAG